MVLTAPFGTDRLSRRRAGTPKVLGRLISLIAWLGRGADGRLTRALCSQGGQRRLLIRLISWLGGGGGRASRDGRRAGICRHSYAEMRLYIEKCSLFHSSTLRAVKMAAGKSREWLFGRSRKLTSLASRNQLWRVSIVYFRQVILYETRCLIFSCISRNA